MAATELTLDTLQLKTKSSGSIALEDLSAREIQFEEASEHIIVRTIAGALSKYAPLDDTATDTYHTLSASDIISKIAAAGGGGGNAPPFFQGGSVVQIGRLGESKISPAGSLTGMVISWESLPTISSGDSWGDGSTADTGKIDIKLYKRDRADDDTSLGSFSLVTTHSITSSTLASHYTEVVSISSTSITSGDELYVEVDVVTNSATVTLGLGLKVMLVYS